MRGDFSTMTVLSAFSPAEAVRLRAEHKEAVPFAGGTDIMVSWNMGLLNNKTILDLSRIKEWRSIKTNKEGVTIGALCTHTDIQKHADIRSRFPLLVKACATVGAAQIQNRGTIGGNIANASPAGDTFPALSVYNAVVNAVSPAGKRKVPFSEIFTGVKKTSLKQDELIESVFIPFLASRPHKQYFRKVGTRSAQAISKVVAAGLVWIKAGRVEELRFALGSVAPTTKRATSAEAFMRGKHALAPILRDAAELLTQDVSPIDDIRSTREYRLRICENLLNEFLGSR